MMNTVIAVVSKVPHRYLEPLTKTLAQLGLAGPKATVHPVEIGFSGARTALMRPHLNHW